MITTTTDNKHRLNIISALAPTLATTIKTPEIKLINSRDTPIIGGDFNGKTKPNNKMLCETITK